MNSIHPYHFFHCKNEKELLIAAQLRYEAYHNVKAIDDNDKKIFLDKYDSMDNCTTCLVYEEAKPVASIRSCIYSEEYNFLPTPAFEVYKNEIEKSIGLDKVIVESNRFVITPSKMDSKILFKMPFRFIFLNLHTFKADYIITAVREKHVSLYKRFLEMEQISGVKKYPNINVEMVLMAADCKITIPKVVAKDPFYSISQNEIDDYSLAVWSNSPVNKLVI